MSSTGFGMGIAIPHAKTDAVKVPRVAILKTCF
nr:PTS sugar transporter subunit IIA [Clostridioides difficile]